jgi:1-phosphofructokinase family hexose kinase
MQAGPEVVTVTPNPSLDLLFEADRLVPDDANRLADPRRRPGGQGINVARAVQRLGGRALAVALLGGRTGAEIEETLAGEGLPLRVVAAAGETRTFVAVRQRADGSSLLLNARGPARTAEDERRLEAAVLDALEQRPRWLACCGSLPDGFTPDFYARLGRAAARQDTRVVVDCDGDALAAAASCCDLLVPNQYEAERLTGAPIRSVDEALAAAESLRRRGPSLVAVTLGVDGAVLIAERTRCHARTLPDASGSAVGAGDVFLAAFLTALGSGTAADGHYAQTIAMEALRQAVAAAAASLRSTGADLVDPGIIPAILSGVRMAC